VLSSLATVLGGVWHWVVHVVERMGDISPYWLVLALTLKTGESALIGLVWRNILRASYPKSRVRFKTAWGPTSAAANHALSRLPHRDRRRRPHRQPAHRDLRLLPPRPRLRQRPERSPDRLSITSRPHLRLVRRRTRTDAPAPTRAARLVANLNPLVRPPAPSTRPLQSRLQHSSTHSSRPSKQQPARRSARSKCDSLNANRPRPS
jgi:hypothetical protein